MRVVLQRVSRAAVRVHGAETGRIGAGYVALVGIARGDGDADLAYIVRKLVGLRLWPAAGDDGGAHAAMQAPLGSRAVLVISQFTLLADTRHGMRPSWDAAAPADLARPLYESLLVRLRGAGVVVASGIFGADMEVELVNQGPVTVVLDSRGQSDTVRGS